TKREVKAAPGVRSQNTPVSEQTANNPSVQSKQECVGFSAGNDGLRAGVSWSPDQKHARWKAGIAAWKGRATSSACNQWSSPLLHAIMASNSSLSSRGASP